MSSREPRLARAEVLSRRWPFARDVLRFFRSVALFQEDLAGRLPSPLPRDPAALVRHLEPLLELVEREGPAALALRAAAWGERPGAERERALRELWESPAGDPLERFFPRVVLQPYAERRREDSPAGEAARAGAGRASAAAPPGACPFCGHPPIASLLREDASAGTVARSLVCSLCALEWAFPRVLCPSCREERPEKLPRYAAEEIPWIRVEACDGCHRYLKTVDLAREPGADPVVDELASTPLDVLAREEGYVKLEPNLAGV